MYEFKVLTSYVCCHKKILCGMAKIVVEAVDVDVDSKKDGSNDHENVVAHKLLSNGIVKSRRSWRGCIELGEWMDQQLGWRKEQIYCNKTEQFTLKMGFRINVFCVFNEKNLHA